MYIADTTLAVCMTLWEQDILTLVEGKSYILILITSTYFPTKTQNTSPEGATIDEIGNIHVDDVERNWSTVPSTIGMLGMQRQG